MLPAIPWMMALLMMGFIAPAQAFEVNGFRSGMKDEVAVSVLRGRVDRVSLFPGSGGRKSTYLGTSSMSAEGEAIETCDGRLFLYSADIRGGFPSFVRLVEQESAVRGPATYSATSQETSSGSWTTIRFSWSVGSDVKQIYMSQVGSQVTQVSIQYKAPSTCPD